MRRSPFLTVPTGGIGRKSRRAGLTRTIFLLCILHGCKKEPPFVSLQDGSTDAHGIPNASATSSASASAASAVSSSEIRALSPEEAQKRAIERARELDWSGVNAAFATGVPNTWQAQLLACTAWLELATNNSQQTSPSSVGARDAGVFNSGPEDRETADAAIRDAQTGNAGLANTQATSERQTNSDKLERADKMLAELSAQTSVPPYVRSYAAFLRRQTLVRIALPEPTAAKAVIAEIRDLHVRESVCANERCMQERQDSRQLLMAAKLARLLGDKATAGALLAELLRRKRTSHALEAEVRAFRLHAISESAGDADGDKRWLAIESSESPDGELASKDVTLSTDERVQRIRSLQRRGHNALSLDELRRLTPNDVPCRTYADLLYASRIAYKDASASYMQCETLERGKEAPTGAMSLLAARALSRADDDEEARKRYRDLADGPGSAGVHAAIRSEARYHEARLATLHGEWANAATAWQRAKARDNYAKRTGFIAAQLAGTTAPRGPDGLDERQRRYLDALAQKKNQRSGKGWRAALQALRVEDPFDLPAQLAHGELPADEAKSMPAQTMAVSSSAPESLALIALEDVRAFAIAGLADAAELTLLGHIDLRPKGKRDGSPLSPDEVCRMYIRVDRGRRILRASSREQAEGTPCGYPKPYQALVTRLARENELDVNFVYAIMRTESSFDPNATSPVGAGGLLQLMPETAHTLAERRGERVQLPLSIRDNLRLGIGYLAELRTMFGGSLPLAAAAYNAGPASVSRWATRMRSAGLGPLLFLIPFDETYKYVARVMHSYALYNYLDGKPAVAIGTDVPQVSTPKTPLP
jgi:soluble lytic murein transglycosylase